MRRACCVLLALLATAGASPRRPLPVPPVPPVHPPTDEYAPVPDRDAQAPRDGDHQGTQVDLHNFRVPNFPKGLGYAPGSRYRTEEDRRPIQTPGLTVRVPLQ